MSYWLPHTPPLSGKSARDSLPRHPQGYPQPVDRPYPHPYPHPVDTPRPCATTAPTVPCLPLPLSVPAMPQSHRRTQRACHASQSLTEPHKAQ